MDSDSSQWTPITVLDYKYYRNIDDKLVYWFIFFVSLSSPFSSFFRSFVLFSNQNMHFFLFIFSMIVNRNLKGL